jgi:titin
MATPNLGNAAVRVKWAPPSNQGASPVTGYTVRVHHGSTLLKTTTTSATARDLLVTGLKNGTAHTFTVEAKNASGTGPVTTVTATPRTAPSAPRIGTSTPGSGAVVVRWAAPLSNGGAPVTGYTVRVYRGSTLVKAVPASRSATNVNVTGLANGAAYRFVVLAANAAGTGAVSAWSATVAPRTVPSAPRITGVSAGRSAVAVSWVAPRNGGAAITTYTVRAYRGSTLVKQMQVSASARRLTMPGLTARAGHSFTVYAANAAGTGAVSARSGTVAPR